MSPLPAHRRHTDEQLQPPRVRVPMLGGSEMSRPATTSRRYWVIATFGGRNQGLQRLFEVLPAATAGGAVAAALALLTEAQRRDLRAVEVEEISQ